MAHSSTAASQLRKVKKPLIERRRRERINEYLNELMILVHEATGTNSAKSSSKMEKAEILEMTVEYLRKLHRSNGSGSLSYQRCRPTVLTSPSTLTSSSSSVSRPEETLHSPTTDDVNMPFHHATVNHSPYDYVSGFSECARQVRRFLLRQQQQQQTGNSYQISDAAPCSTLTGAASLMLWRQLSEHVAVRMRQQLALRCSADTLSQSYAVPEVISTPDLITSPPPTAIQFSTGFSADDNRIRSPLPKSASDHPIFAVFNPDASPSNSTTTPESPHRLTSSSNFFGTNTFAGNACEVSSTVTRDRTYDVTGEPLSAWPSSIVFGDVDTGSGVFSAVVDRLPGCQMGSRKHPEESLRMWRPWGLAADENGNYLQAVDMCGD